jgi:hypothetical protein
MRAAGLAAWIAAPRACRQESPAACRWRPLGFQLAATGLVAETGLADGSHRLAFPSESDAASHSQ